jgi:protein-disulfide isomerase
MKKPNMIKIIFSVFFMASIVSCQNSENAKNQNETSKMVYQAPQDNQVVLKVNEKEVTAQDIFASIKGKIFEKESELYQLKMDQMRSHLLKMYMESDPRMKGLSNDEFLEKYISVGKKPSAQEIENFIKERSIPANEVTPEIKSRIEAFLLVEIKKKAVEQWIDQQSAKNKTVIFLEKPSRPIFNVVVNDSDPTWGDKNAKVTIVEYSDFQCPFCAKGAERLAELRKKYGKKIKIVFKNFPLPYHNNAKDAAMAALCVKEQKADKFWDLHDYMFKNQDKLALEDLNNQVKKMGFTGESEKKYLECVASKKYLATVEADLEAGKNIFVQSTPTFFINGALVNGAQPIEVFVEEIEKHL